MQSSAAKRRRLNDASSTLSKPFKSPLRREPELQESTTKNGNGEAGSDAKPGPISGSASASYLSTTPKRPGNRSTHSSPLGIPTSSSPSSPAATHLTALRKQESALLSRLVSLRRDLDAVQQALKIEQTDQDTELEALVGKWKGVSRDAAEELFVGARDRVNRMGGVGAWKEKMRESRMRRAQGWEGDDGAAGNRGAGSGDDDDEEGVEREKERRKGEIEDELGGGEADEEKKDESVEEDEETFTMDMMLKSLNIELSAIGFDKANQRWID